MEILKIPALSPEECEQVIASAYLCRIAFHGEKYPYLSPFLYVWKGRHLFFLSTNYGAKIKYFRENPLVVVEIEQTGPDLAHYRFVTLCGRLEEVPDGEEKKGIRDSFVGLIRENNLSKNILAALGYSPDEDLEALKEAGRNLVWKLVEVERMGGLKFGDDAD